MFETASWGRRLLAIVIDWIACVGVVLAFTGSSYFGDGPRSGLYVYGLFVLESAFFTVLLGGSFGHLAVRLRVIRADGRPLDLFRAIARPLLILLVVPPLVAGPDRRGLHDMTLRSYIVRLDDLQSGAKAAA
ncbi:RDD family protein [Nocardioides jiangxiensis]|uniref:RDD family protein n=1 Tax=Nocardioides jiangxiensis TaxID=3064524 RepID=A0ABT9AWY8_9ACTN|nr:RDD family protein [Nocardioides sp. WY-20]MDO7867020.1 RDD family protein [Nocardioides sp. WY-20]